MFSSQEILGKKIADRCCRRNLLHSEDIEQIVKECCDDLGMDKPEIIYCETLTRSLSAFYFRKKPYLIYDSCLLEALYIFDGILLTGQKEQDLDKLVYKLIGEELIRNNELSKCLYFSGKYRRLEYAFDKEENHDAIVEMMSLQSYFLIGHELGHLSVGKSYIAKIPDDYRKFINACIKVLHKNVIKDDCQKEFIDSHYEYFMDEYPQNIYDYWKKLWKSKKYEHLIEECYCDWNGVKLLLEHYNNPENSVRAISVAFKYLIIQEAIRSDIEKHRFFFDDSKHKASRAMYFSVLRMEIILLTIRINHLGNIERAFEEMQEKYLLTDCWLNILKKIPSDSAFADLTESKLPDIEQKELVDVLIRTFYYMHVK